MVDEPRITELSGEEAADLALGARRIALVGASADPSRPSHGVMRYLLRAGCEVIPVRPGVEEILGQPCRVSLEEIDGPVDLVNVFRRADAAPDIARSAARIGAPALWLQSGIRSDEAARIAAQAGMRFVQDRCIRTVLQTAGR